MSDPQEKLTIEQELELIRVWLKTWTDPRKGDVKVMQNLAHLWEEVYSVTDVDRPRVLICWTGEVARGAFQQANTLHRVDRQFVVVIMRGHGFANLVGEGKGQEDSPGAVESFVKSVESLRDKIRVMVNITEEPPLDYKGTKPVPNVGPGRAGSVFLDAYAIEFSTANDIQAITSIDPDNP